MLCIDEGIDNDLCKLYVCKEIAFIMVVRYYVFYTVEVFVW